MRGFIQLWCVALWDWCEGGCVENSTSTGASAGAVATRSDVGNDEEFGCSVFFCPSGELGGGGGELGPLYKGDIRA